MDSRYTLLDETTHDTKIAWQMVKRNLDRLTVLTADKGYDWELLRHKLRSENVKLVIKHPNLADTVSPTMS